MTARRTLGLGVSLLALGACTSNGLDASNRLTLSIGHCEVNPVEFGGQTWKAIPSDQFGEGDITSAGYTGTGVARVLTANRLRYRDDSGKTVNFTVDDHGDSARTDPRTWCH
jgi:hypothetical protein